VSDQHYKAAALIILLLKLPKSVSFVVHNGRQIVVQHCALIPYSNSSKFLKEKAIIFISTVLCCIRICVKHPF
jgi:hypothetical protein